MFAFLKKFQLATKKTEGRRNTVEEILPVIDFLLNAFSTALKEAKRQNDLAFIAMIKCGCDMLDKYFSLTDRAPIYVVAVVLHPVTSGTILPSIGRQLGSLEPVQRSPASGLSSKKTTKTLITLSHTKMAMSSSAGWMEAMLHSPSMNMRITVLFP